LNIYSCSGQNLPLPALDYDYSALEPWIDKQTMTIHHLKHHAAYTEKLNAALDTLRNNPQTKHIAKLGVDSILRDLSSLPESVRTTIRNNGGGYVNHALFWKIMGPPVDDNIPTPSGPLGHAIDKTFGGFEEFQKSFSSASVSVFGSGWVFLYVNSAKMLKISSTSNQDSVVMEGVGNIPILALDVWEHAYYLHYQNRRTEYVANWWHVVNWKKVSELYENAISEREL